MFTQKCFIRKNTPELRKKLDEIGRDFVQNGYGEWHVNVEKNEYLFCGDEPFAGDVLCYYMGRVCKPTEGVDCGTNEELFLAIAALRDDTDNMQWFIQDRYVNIGVGGQICGMEPKRKISEKWLLYDQNNKKLSERIKLDTSESYSNNSELRKATVQELIGHFNK